MEKRHATILASIGAVIPVLAASVTSAHAAEIGFKTPSKNIYCIIEPPYEHHLGSDLRCDLQQMTTRPPPAPKNCPLSWGDAFSIAQDGDRGVKICHGDTTRNPALEVLPYGAKWSHDGFVCRSATNGLTCKNARGHGFTLSRAAQRLF